MTSLVYPGALHTRFHHALGAYHLMNLAIQSLRQKGVEISDKECEAAGIAILLHDIGHGPYSHALEHTITSGLSHEHISEYFMERLNTEFKGELSLALEIFKGNYKKKYLHQLVSSQLDVDRLDYLRRDSFYTGVHEGVIGSDRIMLMMNVRNEELVLEEKGILSIEKFLLARRFMYWQVYLHKTVVAAEEMLVRILERAKELAQQGTILFASPALEYFLYNTVVADDFKTNPKTLNTFAGLDDYDIMGAIKVWESTSDPILSMLCKSLINRNLYKIEFHNSPISPERKAMAESLACQAFGLDSSLAHYLVLTQSVENRTYQASASKINILTKDEQVVHFADQSDEFGINVFGKTVKKYFISYPREIAAELNA